MRRPNTCSQQVLSQNSNQYCHVISVTQIAQWQVERKPPSASVFPENPRSIEILSSGSFTTLESKRSTTNKKKHTHNFTQPFKSLSIDTYKQTTYMQKTLTLDGTQTRRMTWLPRKRAAKNASRRDCHSPDLPDPAISLKAKPNNLIETCIKERSNRRRKEAATPEISSSSISGVRASSLEGIRLYTEFNLMDSAVGSLRNLAELSSDPQMHPNATSHFTRRDETTAKKTRKTNSVHEIEAKTGTILETGKNFILNLYLRVIFYSGIGNALKPTSRWRQMRCCLLAWN